MKKLLKFGAVFSVLMFLFLEFDSNAAAQQRLTDFLFNFEVYGDSRTGHVAHQQIVNQMVSLNSDFVLHTGDLVNSGASLDDWNTFLSIVAGYRMKPIKNGLTANFYPSIGNHDYPLDYYDALFGFSHYYSFDYLGYHFIALNTSEGYTVGSDQYNWLVNDLVLNSGKEIIIYFHYPPYSSGPHGGTPAVVDNLVPLFEQYNVGLVLNGHNHIYDRTYPIYQNAVNYDNGIVYVVTGGGGAPLGVFTTGNWWTAFGESTYNFVHLQATSSKIFGTTLNENGVEIDSFEIASKKNTKHLITSLEDDGRKRIKEFSSSGVLESKLFYPNSKKLKNKGARITAGDVDMDGKDELIVGAGEGGKPWVKIFEIDGTLLKKFYAFNKSYDGGVDVAVGDINNDNIDEIAVSKFSGEKSRVKVFNYSDQAVYFSKKVFPKLNTSVAIDMGDVDLDYNDELIVGTGEGVRSRVKFYDILTNDQDGVKLSTKLLPFNRNVKTGIDVAGGDLNGDGSFDVAVSKLSGDRGMIKVFNYSSNSLLQRFSVFRKKHKSGANIEMFDINSDGKTEIIAGARKSDNSQPKVRIFDENGVSIVSTFFAYKKKLGGGVVVAGINE